MSDRAGDILLIGGFLAIAWAWLRTRMVARGSVEIGMPIIHGPMPGSGIGGATGGTPDLSEGFSISAPDWPTDYFGSSFMPTAKPPATQPATAPPPQIDPVEKDYLARTCWGEARGEGKAGQRAVAAVILNRIAHRRYPSTVEAVALQRTWVAALGRYIYQFSMWDPLDHNERLARSVTNADPQFRSCLEVAEEALSGRLMDPTGGATMYYSPSAMPAGRKPAWDFSKLRESAAIGKHVFFVEL